MSLPQNAESLVPVPSAFLTPDDEVTIAMIDYEAGGVAIQDPSQGLTGYTWKIFQVNLDVFVQRNGADPVLLFSQDNITSLSLAFDQNMRPNVAYTLADGTVALRWFDSTIQNFRTTNFGTARCPRLTLDDKRIEMTTTSDVLFFYIKGDELCWRQQRDRYGVERVLVNGILPTTVLKNVGMNTVYRIQFELA